MNAKTRVPESFLNKFAQHFFTEHLEATVSAVSCEKENDFSSISERKQTKTHLTFTCLKSPSKISRKKCEYVRS